MNIVDHQLNKDTDNKRVLMKVMKIAVYRCEDTHNMTQNGEYVLSLGVVTRVLLYDVCGDHMVHCLLRTTILFVSRKFITSL